MKTYQDFIELNEPEEINEISLKTLSSVAITARLRAVQNKISSLTIRSSNDVEDNLAFPSSEQVNQVATRLQKKGWFEYLIYGRGYKKLPIRIKQLFIESQLNYESGIKVLNDILRD